MHMPRPSARLSRINFRRPTLSYLAMVWWLGHNRGVVGWAEHQISNGRVMHRFTHVPLACFKRLSEKKTLAVKKTEPFKS